MKAVKHTGPDKTVELKEVQLARVSVEVEGISPLIVNHWSQKARQEMLDAAQGKKPLKTPKDPDAEFAASRYILDDKRDGFPAAGFRSAIIGGARHFRAFAMTEIRQALYITGEGPLQLVPIIGEAESREDPVRVGRGGADLRYRAMYWPWSAVLQITYAQTILPDEETLLALIDAGGMGGIGEWRPGKSSGNYGMFGVKA